MRTALLVAAIAAVVWTPVLRAQDGRSPAGAARTDSTRQWNGWYAGGHFGYSQGGTNAGGSRNPLGFSLGGLNIGYNAVLQVHWFAGAEADVSFPDFFEDGVVSARKSSSGSSVTEKLDLVSTMRGRFGYAANRWLIYGAGGFVLAEPRFFESTTATTDSDRVLRVRTGWTVGAGAELRLAPDWSARADYVYDRLGATSVAFASGTRFESQTGMHSLRLGLNHTLGSSPADAAVHENAPARAVAASRWNLHAQSTFVDQGYFAFRSPYEGTNSLSGASQLKNTVSATAFLGLRLWENSEVYFNPEIDQGSGLDATHGVAAFPNGEAQKAVFPMPRFVVDRLLWRQTFGLGGEQESLSDGANQVAGKRDISRITVVAGRMAVTDYFDDNAYANDPRTNFLNWNAYGAGAYDWTMDQISWTWGALVELNQKNWALRAGYFLLPVVSSNNSFDTHIPARGEYTAEWEWRYLFLSRTARLRVFAWVNHGTMGSYAAALAMPATTPNYPDITQTREVRTNPGVVINVEQPLTEDLGVFSRASWNGGRVEILGGTDCSDSFSLGTVLKGRLWGRPDDRIGVSGVIGGLSATARAYFAAGGTGILIGDGALNYRSEKVFESYYAYAARKWLTLSADYQFLVDPAYNADRGPVSIFAVRAHAAF